MVEEERAAAKKKLDEAEKELDEAEKELAEAKKELKEAVDTRKVLSVKVDGGDKSDETAKKLDEAKAEVTQLRAAVHDAVTVLKIAHETVARLAASPVAQAVSTRKSRCFKCPLSRVQAPLTALVHVDSANVRWKPDVYHGASVLPCLFHF